MRIILPAILVKDKKELEEQLSKVHGLVSWVHLDIMDGIFAPSTTSLTPEDVGTMRVSMHIEAHLMIDHPEKVIDRWIASPVQRILLHYESTDQNTLILLLKKIALSGKSSGVVLNMQTPLWVIDFLLSEIRVEVIQLMSIDTIGTYGIPFNDKVLYRIAALHQKHPAVVIAVDGGVSLKNISALQEAGASHFSVGSAIFHSANIHETIKQFKGNHSSSR